jgi:hypothetical protein
MNRQMKLTSLVVLVVSAPMMLGLLEISSCGLNRENFTRIVAGGVDNRLNSYPWAMELYDGDKDGTPELYIGTIANALCIQIPLETFIYDFIPDFTPPERWQCRNDLWGDPNDANTFVNYFLYTVAPAYVYRGTYDEGAGTWNWARVWEPNYIYQASGFRGAKAFNDAMYMLGNRSLGAIVWKTTDGATFTPASPAGIGLPAVNTGLRGTTVFNGKLYVASDKICAIYGSENPSTDPNSWQQVNSTGFVTEGGATHEEVSVSGTATGATSNTLIDSVRRWRANLHAGLYVRITGGVGVGQSKRILSNTATTLTIQGTWSPIPTAGSTYQIYNPTEPDNGPCWQLGTANGYLYATTFNQITGGELWKSSDPRPGNWTRVIYGGYGNTISSGYQSIQGFGNHVYVGTAIYPPNVHAFGDFQGCEVLRADANDNVEVLVGPTRPPGTPGTNNGAPLSGIGPGFDYMPNTYCWYMGVHDGWLYVGTYDYAGQLIDILNDQFPEGWPPEVADLMEQVFWGTDEARRGGFDVWRTKDGINWVPVILDGFGDWDNYGIRGMKSSPWGFLLGVANSVDGFEVWLGK